MESKRVVIVGGGYAGIEAAKILERTAKKADGLEILLIDRNPYHTLMTELHEVAGSRTEPEAVKVSFHRIFGGSRVQVLVDEVIGIDFPANLVQTKRERIPYDYLIVSTGGRPEFFGIEGVQQHSFTLWSLEDAIRIRNHVELMFREAARESDPNQRRKLLTFVVAGAGFTGIELIGELCERADVLCRHYQIDRSEVRLVVIEAQERILPILADKPRRAAERYLARKGVTVLVNAPIVKAEEGAYILNDLTRVEGSTLVWTCGVQASEFTARISLTKGKVSNDQCSIATPEGIHGMAACYFEEDEKEIVGQRGRILVNEFMQSVDYGNVYLCGDVIWYVNKDRVVPQIVENALQSAATAARNILATVRGQPQRPYRPEFHGFMVSIGSRFAVATVMRRNLIGFSAMALKHLVNLHYLWELAGVNAVWHYIADEFLHVRNRRSLLGGHLAAKIPAFLAVPARLWLGFVWVLEGLNKIAEGWLRFDRSRTGFLFSRGVTQAGTTTADATAAATAWTTEAAQGVSSATDAATAATATHGTGTEALGKLLDLDSPVLSPDSWPVTLFRTVFMDNLAAHIPYPVLQTAIVVSEVLIGLALIGGLLTLPAAAAAIALCGVFLLSGMFTWSQLSLVFLAVVLLGGAGNSFGLDYWVLPWVRDRWASLRWVQRHHLYLGEPTSRRRRT